MLASLRLTGGQHELLREHLFPGDDLEAVAVLLCGRRAGQRHVLCVHEILLIPHDACERTPERINWPTRIITPLLDKVAASGMAIVKIHSHPGSFDRFSWVDNASDLDLFSSVYGWTDDGAPHGGAIMLLDGRIFGRIITEDLSFEPFERISIAGDDIKIWLHDATRARATEVTRRTAQAFGQGTISLLQHLSIAVIGASGTGGPVIEQLARTGVGELVLVDPDVIEEKNLNRIPNATHNDARTHTPKVLVQARAIKQMGFGTRVVTLNRDLASAEVVRRVAECDVVIGCMDSADGRHLLNRLSATYLVPYIDVGVRIDADGLGSVGFVGGTINYLKPDASTLLERGLYTQADLEAAAMRRKNPDAYEALRREKYIVGANEDRPAVVSVNTLMASAAVLELLARLHPYRMEPNRQYERLQVDHTNGEMFPILDENIQGDGPFQRVVGRGDSRPLLDMPELSEGVP